MRQVFGVAKLVIAIAAAGAMGGCLVSGHSNTQTSGAYVGPSTFSQVEPGTTRIDWVLATFGNPSSTTTLDDGSEIWKWEYTKTKSGRGSVFVLYSGSDSSTSQSAAFVQVRDGVVVKAWRD